MARMAFDRQDRSGTVNGPMQVRHDPSALWTRHADPLADDGDRWSPVTAVCIVIGTSASLWALIAVLTVRLIHLH